MSAWNLLTILKNSENNWGFQWSTIVSKILIEGMILRPTRDSNARLYDLKSNDLPPKLPGLKDYASLSNLVFQFQEFEALDPEI